MPPAGTMECMGRALRPDPRRTPLVGRSRELAGPEEMIAQLEDALSTLLVAEVHNPPA